MAEYATEPSEVDGNSYGITSNVRRETAEKTADGMPSTTAPAPDFIADCEQSNAAPVNPFDPAMTKIFPTLCLCASIERMGKPV
jgi:hypothetical protein